MERGRDLEHEYDHVFLGTGRGAPRPDPGEVSEWRWPGELHRERTLRSHRFTPWFHLAFDELRARSLV